MIFYSYFYLKNNLKGTNDNFTDFQKFYTCKSRLKIKNRNQNIRRIPAAVQETSSRNKNFFEEKSFEIDIRYSKKQQ